MKRTAIIMHRELGICTAFTGDKVWAYPNEIILDWYAEAYAIPRNGLYMIVACPIDEPLVKELEPHLLEWQKKNSPKFSKDPENAIENATII